MANQKPIPRFNLRGVIFSLILLVGIFWTAGPDRFGAARAEQDEAAKTLALVRSTYGKITGLTARFVQTEERPGVGVSVREEGTLSFSPPDRMRWDYEGKSPHKVVVNKSLVFIYMPGRKQVMKRTMTPEEMRGGPATFLSGLSKIEESYTVQAPASSGGLSLPLDLFPLSADTPYEKIGVLVDAKTGLIQRLSIFQRIGNVTIMTFSDIKTGVKLKESLFAYDVPEGTEVVEP